MKAAVYYETGGPEVLRYEDVPDPAMAGNEVLVAGGGHQHRGRRHAQPRRRRDGPGAAHRRLPVRGDGAWPWATRSLHSARATGW